MSGSRDALVIEQTGRYHAQRSSVPDESFFDIAKQVFGGAGEAGDVFDDLEVGHEATSVGAAKLANPGEASVLSGETCTSFTFKVCKF